MKQESKERVPGTAPGAQLLTVGQVAARYGVHKTTVTRWVRSGLPATRQGEGDGVYLIDKADLLAWKRNRKSVMGHPPGHPVLTRAEAADLAAQLIDDAVKAKRIRAKVPPEVYERVGAALRAIREPTSKTNASRRGVSGPSAGAVTVETAGVGTTAAREEMRHASQSP